MASRWTQLEAKEKQKTRLVERKIIDSHWLHAVHLFSIEIRFSSSESEAFKKREKKNPISDHVERKISSDDLGGGWAGDLEGSVRLSATDWWRSRNKKTKKTKKNMKKTKKTKKKLKGKERGTPCATFALRRFHWFIFYFFFFFFFF